MSHLQIPVLIALLFSLSGLLHAQEYSDQVKKWPAKTLQFTEEMPMKDIFDSGIQPYRWPGDLGAHSIGFRHLNLTIITRRGLTTPALPMERAEIRIRQPGSGPVIIEAEFFTPPLTVNEARTEMTKWLPFVEDGLDKAAGLDRYLAGAKADWLHYPYVNGVFKAHFAIRLHHQDEVTYSVGFRQAFDWDAPVRMIVRIGTFELPTRRKSAWSTELLQPPPGYEQLSMETPSEWGPDAHYVPVTTEYRSPEGSVPPGVKLPETLPDWDAVQKGKPRNNPNNPGQTPGAAPNQRTGTYWFALCSLWLITVLALRWIWKKRKHAHK